MKKTFILPVLLFGTCISNLFAQKVFEGHYGTNRQDLAYATAPTNDGGYIMTGLIHNDADTNGAIFVLKTNDRADTTWSLIMGGPNLQGGNSVIQTADGGYMVSGHTQDFGSLDCDAYLMKLDNNGKFQWLTHYGGDSDDISMDVKQLADGGYVFAGITASFGNPGSSERRHAYLGRTNGTGDSLWTKFYAGNGTETLYSIVARPSGGFFTTGFSTSFGNGEEDGWLICLNNNGDSLWTRFYRAAGNSRYFRIIATTDNGYMIAGFTTPAVNGQSVGLAIKLDASGNELWEKTYSNPGNAEILGDVVELPNGNFLFSGDLYPTPTTSIAYTMATDEYGVKISDMTFGGANSIASAIAAQGNNSYLIAGSSTQYGNPAGDLYFMEMDNTVSGVPTIATTRQRQYPNPVHNQSMVIILPGIESSQTVNIEVVTMAGEKVLTQQNIPAKDIAVDCSNIACGLYFYNVTCKDGKVFKGKFEVE